MRHERCFSASPHNLILSPTSHRLCPNTLYVPCPTAPRFLRSEGLRCGRCSRTFNSSEQYIDLTVSSGAKPKVYERKEWAGTELFRCGGDRGAGELMAAGDNRVARFQRVVVVATGWFDDQGLGEDACGTLVWGAGVFAQANKSGGARNVWQGTGSAQGCTYAGQVFSM